MVVVHMDFKKKSFDIHMDYGTLANETGTVEINFLSIHMYRVHALMKNDKYMFKPKPEQWFCLKYSNSLNGHQSVKQTSNI